MKIIRFFLKIIALAILLFLATGLLVKEVSYQVHITINKPTATVFATFKNPLERTHWIKNIEKITPIYVQNGVVGSTYNSIFKSENSGMITVNEEVIAFIPDQKITFFLTTNNLLKTDDFVFTQKDDKTIITQNTVLRSKSYLQQCLFPYLKNSIIKQDKKYLTDFKLYIEKT